MLLQHLYNILPHMSILLCHSSVLICTSMLENEKGGYKDKIVRSLQTMESGDSEMKTSELGLSKEKWYVTKLRKIEMVWSCEKNILFCTRLPTKVLHCNTKGKKNEADHQKCGWIT